MSTKARLQAYSPALYLDSDGCACPTMVLCEGGNWYRGDEVAALQKELLDARRDVIRLSFADYMPTTSELNERSLVFYGEDLFEMRSE